MKTLLTLILSSLILFAQRQDGFVKLDYEGHYSFNNKFNQEYNIIPGVNNLYKGFIVKPFDREGCYIWALMKHKGYLKDTIIWMSKATGNQLLQRLPVAGELDDSSLYNYDKIVNRATILSHDYGRKRIPLLISDSANQIDKKILINPKYEKEYIYYHDLMPLENWIIKTENETFENYAIKGKKGNKLILKKNDEEIAVNINNINLARYPKNSVWYVGMLLGIPTGGLIGGLLGALITRDVSGTSNNEYNGVFGGLIGGVILSVAGGIFGGIIANNASRGPYIKLESEDNFDRYFELDQKTYFTLPQIGSDNIQNVESSKDSISVINNKQDTATNITRKDNKLVAPVNSTEEKDINKQINQTQSQDTKFDVSLGAGFFAPLNCNLNLLFYVNEDLGFGYTGLPFQLDLNDNSDASRFSIFYRIHKQKNFFDNVGIQIGIRHRSFYDLYDSYNFDTNNINPTFKNYDVGVFYELSLVGIYASVGLYKIINIEKSSELYFLNESFYFNLQIGYRYSF